MDRFKVILLGKSLKFYQNCSLEFAQRLNLGFKELEKNPFFGPHIKLLKTHKGRKIYRYRVGEYRIIYEIDKGLKKAGILSIGPRSSVYRDL